MKSDSTEKSEIKIIDKVKTSDKNNLKEGINQKTILQNHDNHGLLMNTPTLKLEEQLKLVFMILGAVVQKENYHILMIFFFWAHLCQGTL